MVCIFVVLKGLQTKSILLLLVLLSCYFWIVVTLFSIVIWIIAKYLVIFSIANYFGLLLFLCFCVICYKVFCYFVSKIF